MQSYARQALPLVWDFVEMNPFGGAAGDAREYVSNTADILAGLGHLGTATAIRCSATAVPLANSSADAVITDPPYYDNISYADLSDFFYIWLRRSLKNYYPALFATLAVPKDEELVAVPYRHGTKQKAEVFFLDGMTRAMHKLAEQCHPAFPVTIY